ncbi:MAG: SDR family oxidoreductase [Bacteroidota bacterium]
MKKIIVFGATGSIGQQVVKQALEAGHQITAFTRNKAKVSMEHAHLRIVEGDVLDAHSVEKAIEGHQVVICALGAGRKGTVRSLGTKHIIQGMQKHGIDRLICQTTLGAGDSEPTLNFFWRHIMFGWFLKKAYLDHQEQETEIRNSHTAWTIVRPAAFTDGPLTKTYQHGFSAYDSDLRLKISRSDVAHFMLQQLDNKAYLRKSPGLSY